LSSHKDGWRPEHFKALASDDECVEAISTFIVTVTNEHIPLGMADYMVTAILALIKKDT
jgi:hypothetical protein